MLTLRIGPIPNFMLASMLASTLTLDVNRPLHIFMGDRKAAGFIVHVT